MSSTRDHLGHQGARSPATATRRPAEQAPAVALAGRDDPRLAHGGAGADLMRLQRTAGNAAVSALVAPSVQRAVEIDEITSEVDTAAPEAGGDASAGPVSSDGGATTISGSQIHLDAPMVDAPGVVRVGTIIADTVVGSSYTPGAGNIW